MQKTKKILVPIDFSPCSENALAYAIQFASKINASIHLLNVTVIRVENTANPYIAELVVAENIENARQSLKNSLSKVKKSLNHNIEKFPNIETIVEIGSASAMIPEIAEENQFDFIIMGTQGENSKSYLLFGSTASTLVENAPCPLIIIPHGASFQPAINMGYASNLTNSDPFEIWRATQLIKPIQPIAINCIHFSEKKYTSERFDEFKSFFAEKDPDSIINFHSIDSKDKLTDLNVFIDKHQINLMVMYRPSRSFWKSLFGESFTKQMSMQTTIPLLILKEE